MVCTEREGGMWGQAESKIGIALHCNPKIRYQGFEYGSYMENETAYCYI